MGNDDHIGAAELTDLRDELRALREEVGRLRAEVDVARSGAPTAAAGAPVAVTEATAADQPVEELVDRRAALRRGGKLAAAAVAGGAAIVAGTASPAAATTLTGSGNPGLVGNGVGGPGLDATTNTAGSGGVKAAVSVDGAFGVLASHSANGSAIKATGGAASSPVMLAESSTNTAALKAVSTGTAADLQGGQLSTTTLSVSANGLGNGAFISQQGSGVGVNVSGSGIVGTGMNVSGFNIGAVVNGSGIGMRLRSTKTQLELGAADTVPTTRANTHPQGAIVNDGADVWVCVEAGSPGRWRKLGGTASAGAFHVLPAPIRVCDTRALTQPPVNGPKSPLAAGSIRTIDVTLNSSGVPAGATAAWITVLLVNAAAGNGNFTIWANGVTKPQSNTLVWGGADGRFAITALTALDAEGKCQVSSSGKTDLVLDVLGYYR